MWTGLLTQGIFSISLAYPSRLIGMGGNPANVFRVLRTLEELSQ